MYPDHPVSNSQSGITLLEVLITIVVLSFGLLGVAGLQVTSLKSTQSSYYRSIANSLAYDIVDKLRANTLSNPASIQTATIGYYLSPAASTKDCSALVGAAVCSASELANFEIDRWNVHSDGVSSDGGSVGKLLPAGKGKVCRDSTPYDGTSAAPACDGAGQWVVKVWWDDSRGKLAANSSDATATTEQRLVVVFTP